MKVTVNKQYTVILEKTDKQLLEELINNSWGGLSALMEDAQ